MSIPLVCQTCSRRYVDHMRRLTPQLQAKATFISLITPRPAAGKPAREIAGIAETDDSRRIPPATKNRTHKGSRRDAGDALESLFEETVKPNSDIARPSIPAMKTPSPETYERVDRLRQKLIAKEVDLGDAWQFFVENLGPDVWRGLDQQIAPPTTLSAVSRTLFTRILNARQSDNVPEGIPNFFELTKVYSEAGMLNQKDWMRMIWAMLKKLIHQSDVQKIAAGSRENSTIDEELIKDLTGVWRLLSANANPSHRATPEEASDHGFEFLPAVNHRDILRAKRRGGLDAAFGVVFPGIRGDSKKDLAAAAILTFDVFTALPPTVQNESGGRHKFLLTLARVMNMSQISLLDLKGLFKSSSYGDWTEKYSHNWPSIMDRSKKLSLNSSNIQSYTETPQRSEFKRIGQISLKKRVEQATTRRDLRGMDRLWAEAAAMQPSIDSSEPKHEEHNLDQPAALRFCLSQELCNRFILAYMTLRQPERAVQVWNHMITVGVMPDLYTWNAMLEGGKAARDWKAIEDVWARLVSSGTVPDAVCWTTRINGLIDSGRIEHGIKALDDMGRIWLQAAKLKHNITKEFDLSKIDDIDGYVKPTISIINAAIAGLVRRRRMDFAPRIIAWAGKFGIAPDVFTYNILLRPLIREGRNEEAQKLLQAMQASGVRADVATFTTILDETFRADIPYTAAEQNALVANVFEEMEAAGVQANQQTYTKIVYGLLESCKDGDMSAAKAVMHRMTAEGLQPSPHIYTIFLQHHLARSPPDTEAARSLIETLVVSSTPVDHVFWDRVIEGFARIGDTNYALSVLGKQDKDGHHVGWHTLTVLIQALLTNGDVEMAKRVLADVRADRGGPPGKEEKGKEGQHMFWMVMAENSLVNPEEVNI